MRTKRTPNNMKYVSVIQALRTPTCIPVAVVGPCIRRFILFHLSGPPCCVDTRSFFLSSGNRCRSIQNTRGVGVRCEARRVFGYFSASSAWLLSIRPWSCFICPLQPLKSECGITWAWRCLVSWPLLLKAISGREASSQFQARVCMCAVILAVRDEVGALFPRVHSRVSAAKLATPFSLL